MIGITTRIDVADLLEKRVRSRCSQRQMWLPALATPAQCGQYLATALALPAVPAGSAPVPQATAVQAKRFRDAWGAHTTSLCAAVEHSVVLRRRLSMGVTPNQLQTALRLMLSDLSAHRSEQALPTLDTFERAFKYMMVPREEATIHDCSAVELLLLICLKKLSDKELPPPHTLRMVLREYSVFVGSNSHSTRQYDYPKALLVKSFEHLCALGLVRVVREQKHRGLANEQLPLRMTTDPQALRDYVEGNQCLPIEVYRFGTQMTL